MLVQINAELWINPKKITAVTKSSVNGKYQLTSMTDNFYEITEKEWQGLKPHLKIKQLNFAATGFPNTRE